MDYDRFQVKLLAKSKLRQARPRSWLVTLVYLLLIFVLTYVLPIAFSLFTSDTPIYDRGIQLAGYEVGRTPAFTLLFLSVLLALFIAVLSAGYRYWSISIWRGRPTAMADLFSCFHMAGRVILLFLLLTAFSLLWALPAMAVTMIPAGVLFALFDSDFLQISVSILAWAGFMALFLNRILRYSMASYILLDHPEWNAMDCLDESKRLMEGRRMALFTLCFSFIGWYLLLLLLLYLIIFVLTFVVVYLFLTMIGFHITLTPALLLPLVGPVCILPLVLWLTSYVSVSIAGFYDCTRAVPPTDLVDTPISNGSSRSI